jgi:hypothetical protein
MFPVPPVFSREITGKTSEIQEIQRSSHAEASTVPVSLLDLLAVLRHFLHHERAKHPLPLTAREVTRLPMLWGYAASMRDIWWEPLMGYNGIWFSGFVRKLKRKNLEFQIPMDSRVPKLTNGPFFRHRPHVPPAPWPGTWIWNDTLKDRHWVNQASAWGAARLKTHEVLVFVLAQRHLCVFDLKYPNIK